MRRSNSTSKKSIRFPNTFKNVFIEEKYKILQRIKVMFEQQTKPLTLLLVSPHNIENLRMHKDLTRNSCSSSRTRINIKLQESDRKHKNCQEAAAAVEQCYHLTLSNEKFQSKLMEMLQHEQSNAFKTGNVGIKKMATQAIEKIKKRYIQGHAFEISNTRNNTNSKNLTLHPSTSKITRIFRTFTPFENRVQRNTTNRSQYSTRPPNTITQKFIRNFKLTSSSQLRRQSMPKTTHLQPLIQRHDQNDIFNSDRSSLPSKVNVLQAIEELPITAWPDEDLK